MNQVLTIEDEKVVFVGKDSLNYTLSVNSLIKLLGYNQTSVPLPVIESIEKILPKVKNVLIPKGGFKLFNSQSVIFNKDSFIVKNEIFDCGRIIASNFKGCDSLAILTTTLGDKISDKIRDLMDDGDFLSGFILDKIASEIVEQYADKIEIMISQLIQNYNMSITNRYSPGYCGWDVKEQQKIFSLLPKDFCGINLTESSLMIPIKSVSAVIGIGKNAVKRDYQCSICDIEFCYKRERDV